MRAMFHFHAGRKGELSNPWTVFSHPASQKVHGLLFTDPSTPYQKNNEFLLTTSQDVKTWYTCMVISLDILGIIGIGRPQKKNNLEVSHRQRDMYPTKKSEVDLVCRPHDGLVPAETFQQLVDNLLFCLKGCVMLSFHDAWWVIRIVMKSRIMWLTLLNVMMIECCLHVEIRGLQLQMYICAIEHVQLHMDCVWMFELQLTLKAPRRERVILFWLFKAWGKKSVNTVWLVLRATQRPIAFDGGTNSAGDYWPQIHNDHIYIYT